VDDKKLIERMIGNAANALVKSSEKPNVEGLTAAASLIVAGFQTGKMLTAFGNGGSMTDAMHLCAELVGKYDRVRAPLPAIALSDTGSLTCMSNDFGYEEIFSRPIEAYRATLGSVVAISTSGESLNVVNGAKKARELGIPVVALTGRSNSTLGHYADVELCAYTKRTDEAQLLHTLFIHILVELIEHKYSDE
jgi:D-sedoheptulose 7-phosphate isomerase